MNPYDFDCAPAFAGGYGAAQQGRQASGGMSDEVANL